MSITVETTIPTNHCVVIRRVNLSDLGFVEQDLHHFFQTALPGRITPASTSDDAHQQAEPEA
jgi:hypothetical protein